MISEFLKIFQPGMQELHKALLVVPFQEENEMLGK